MNASGIEQVSGNRLRVLLALGIVQARNGRGFAPIRDIARVVGLTMRAAHRHLWALEAIGLAERTPHGHWREKPGLAFTPADQL